MQYNIIQYNTIQVLLSTPHGGFSETKNEEPDGLNEAPEVYKIGRTCLYLSLD